MPLAEMITLGQRVRDTFSDCCGVATTVTPLHSVLASRMRRWRSGLRCFWYSVVAAVAIGLSR